MLTTMMIKRVVNSIMAFVSDLACISLQEVKTMATIRASKSALDSVIMIGQIQTHQNWRSLPPHPPRGTLLHTHEELSREFCTVGMVYGISQIVSDHQQDTL